MSILVVLVPSDADGGDDDGDVPTTLPAWQVPRGITFRDNISRSGNPSP